MTNRLTLSSEEIELLHEGLEEIEQAINGQFALESATFVFVMNEHLRVIATLPPKERQWNYVIEEIKVK